VSGTRSHAIVTAVFFDFSRADFVLSQGDALAEAVSDRACRKTKA